MANSLNEHKLNDQTLKLAKEAKRDFPSLGLKVKTVLLTTMPGKVMVPSLSCLNKTLKHGVRNVII